MKKSFLIFFIAIFFACDNEIDINEEWSDIPVIYAIFDSGSKVDGDGSDHEGIIVPQTMWDGTDADEFDSDGDYDDQNDMHLIRIQKSFLGDLRPESYIDVSDSIYYNSDELDVWVEIVNVAGQVLDEYPLELATNSDLESLKDDGAFHSNSHYLFKLKEETLDVDKKYRISVRNTSTGVVASAETNIVEPISISSIRSATSAYNPSEGNPLNTGLANAILTFSETGAGNNTIYFPNSPLRNAKMYSVILIFNYLEQSAEDYETDKPFLEMENPNDPNKLFFPVTGVKKKSKKFTLQGEYVIEDPGGYQMPSINIGPSDFLSRLRNQFVNQNEGVYRYPLYSFLQESPYVQLGGIFHRCIDIYITAVNLDFYTYFEAGAPSSNINQERPMYNNVDNGVGHVSSRSSLVLSNMRIDNASQKEIATSGLTKQINFACYKESYNFSNSFYVAFGDDCVTN